MKDGARVAAYGRRVAPLLLSLALHALVISGVVYLWRSLTREDPSRLTSEEVIDIRIVPESELVPSSNLQVE